MKVCTSGSLADASVMSHTSSWRAAFVNPSWSSSTLIGTSRSESPSTEQRSDNRLYLVG